MNPLADGLRVDNEILREALTALVAEYERIGADREREAYQVALNMLIFTRRTTAV
jgi:hypothetical protein